MATLVSSSAHTTTTTTAMEAAASCSASPVLVPEIDACFSPTMMGDEVDLLDYFSGLQDDILLTKKISASAAKNNINNNNNRDVCIGDNGTAAHVDASSVSFSSSSSASLFPSSLPFSSSSSSSSFVRRDDLCFDADFFKGLAAIEDMMVREERERQLTVAAASAAAARSAIAASLPENAQATAATAAEEAPVVTPAPVAAAKGRPQRRATRGSSKKDAVSKPAAATKKKAAAAAAAAAALKDNDNSSVNDDDNDEDDLFAPEDEDDNEDEDSTLASSNSGRRRGGSSKASSSSPSTTTTTTTSSRITEARKLLGMDVPAVTSGSRRTVDREDPTRNARLAKQNRERKKAYVAKLESTIEALEADLSKSADEQRAKDAQLRVAQTEIAELRAALKNQSLLAPFFSALQAVPGFKLVSGNDEEASSSSAKRSRADHGDVVVPLMFNVHLKA
jgi:hypothetical protein